MKKTGHIIVALLALAWQGTARGIDVCIDTQVITSTGSLNVTPGCSRIVGAVKAVHDRGDGRQDIFGEGFTIINYNPNSAAFNITKMDIKAITDQDTGRYYVSPNKKEIYDSKTDRILTIKSGSILDLSKEQEPVESVPESVTIGAAALGVGAIVTAVLLKRKKKKTPGDTEDLA